MERDKKPLIMEPKNLLTPIDTKRKRTTRQRSSSAFNATRTITPSCSQSGCSDKGRSREEGRHDSITSTLVLPGFSAEELEVADALLLLSQGEPKTEADETSSEDLTVLSETFDKIGATQRKSVQDSNAKNEYPFECKLCNRSFKSHQALGGHKASHKRLKIGEEFGRTSTVKTHLDMERARENGLLIQLQQSPEEDSYLFIKENHLEVRPVLDFDLNCPATEVVDDLSRESWAGSTE